MPANAKKEGPLLKFFKRRGWCQGALARTKRGAATHWTDANAVSFCLVGAAEKVELSLRGSERLVNAVLKAGGAAPSYFNDQPGMTKRKIMCFLKKYSL